MRRALGFVVLGVGAYAAFLVATVPASVLASVVERESQGRVSMPGARGTLWHGQSALAVRTPAGGVVDVRELSWRWKPASLAAGRIAFDIAWNDPAVEGAAEVGRGWSTWHVRGLASRLDASLLAQAVPVLAPWKPQGPVRVTSDLVAFEPLRGEAIVTWSDAAVALSPVRPLGSYRLHAASHTPTGRLVLTTTAGPLRLAGEGTFAGLQSLRLDGTARAEGPEAAGLEPLLDLLGPRRPDGARTLQLRAP